MKTNETYVVEFETSGGRACARLASRAAAEALSRRLEADPDVVDGGVAGPAIYGPLSAEEADRYI